MKKNILLLNYKEYDENSIQKLSLKYNLFKKNFKNKKAILTYLKKNKKIEFYAIFVCLGIKFDKEIFKLCNKIRFLISPTTGLDHINLKDLKKMRIKLISLKNDKILKKVTSTAEHTWALILGIARNITQYSNMTSKKKWLRNKFENIQLNHKKIGIIGYGRLGKMISKYAKAFGMRQFIYDKSKNIPNFTNINKIFKLCDIVTIHIDSNLTNFNFINKKILKNSKKNQIIINTSRGEVIDENEVFRLLKKNHLKAAGLDVLIGDSYWGNKIPKSKHKILNSLKNKIILTPHSAGFSKEANSITRNRIVNKFLKIK